ncbi:ATP-binding protein [Lactonifactor longoviformis]|uniref:ATP-binding protein n=1 Tax=Lactonifactor longoviformis TaxID=341220 RepID=UPI0036F197EC
MGYFDDDTKEMLEVYLAEAGQLAKQLSGVLFSAEDKNEFSGEDIHAVFRIMHTIKGSSAMMGLNSLSSLAHTLEDLFGYYREVYGKIEEAEPELYDLLFAVSDYIEGELSRMQEDDYAPGSTDELQNWAETYLRRVSAGEEVSEAACETVSEVSVPGELKQKAGTVVRILFESGCRMENVRAFMLVRQIKGLCSDLETYPADLETSKDSAGYIGDNGVFIRFQSSRKDEVIQVLSKGLFVAECRVMWECSREEAAKGTAKAGGKKEGEAKEPDFLNVKTDRLDKLQNLSGELLIQMQALDSYLGEKGLDELREGTAHQINRLISEVEHTVMQMRMVPVARIVPSLRKILRDICKDTQKEAELIINCGDIEADKSVVDYIAEALLHLIRNAVDHGIESPEERTEAGKSRKGKIIFTVGNTVGELRISVSDDGRGLDEEKIKARARERGLFHRPEEEYSAQEIQSFILHPGFTTNAQVTEYSGRGVGLDVVKKIMEDAGGHLYINSEAGKGCTFTITVPLTLATMECTRFRVGDYRFSLPARHVFHFLDYGDSKKNIQKANGLEYILFQDRMLPFLDLHKVYDIAGETPATGIIIYVRGTEREGCILVDSMYQQKRIVIKQLPQLFGSGFRQHTGINGCSIMGNGKICTALDTEILIGNYIHAGTVKTEEKKTL